MDESNLGIDARFQSRVLSGAYSLFKNTLGTAPLSPDTKLRGLTRPKISLQVISLILPWVYMVDVRPALS